MPKSPDPSSRTRRISPRLLAIGALVLVASALIGQLAGPERHRLSAARSGDAALADRVIRALGNTDGLRSLVVAEVTPGTVTWAGMGDVGAAPGAAPEASTIYELGSITKTFTGALLALAIERGEVRADDLLATHLPELAGTAAGQVSLGSLAQHRSGLPRLGATASGQVLVAALRNANPYATTTTAQLISDAKLAPVSPGQPPTYSNFAVSLLGVALARAAGVPDYTTLFLDRIAGPLGMSDTRLSATTAQVPAAASPGFHVNGLRAPRWSGEGYLPSGSSTFTTLRDLSRWAQSQLVGGAGANAQRATDELAEDRIGWGWITSAVAAQADHPARTMIWHNGGTAGFAALLALDPDARKAVIVMGNSDASLDGLGPALLFDLPGPRAIDPMTVGGAWFVIAVAAWLTVSAQLGVRGDQAKAQVVSGLIAAGFGLLLAWRSGPWFAVGGWVWGLLLAPALAALAISVVTWRARPWWPPRHAWLSVVGLLVNVSLVAAMLWLY